MLPIAALEPHRRRRGRGHLRRLILWSALVSSTSACLQSHGPSFAPDATLAPDPDGGVIAMSMPEPGAPPSRDAGQSVSRPGQTPAPPSDTIPRPPQPVPPSDAGLRPPEPRPPVDAGVRPTPPPDASLPQEPRGDAQAPEAGQDAAPPGDAGPSSGCIALHTAIKDAVSRCFSLTEEDLVCLQVSLTAQRVSALSLRAKSITQGEARRGIHCAYVALRAQCLESAVDQVEECYVGQ